MIWLQIGLAKCTQHSVHPTGGSLRVFRQFVWLEVCSGKMALPRPAHPRVTHTVGRKDQNLFKALQHGNTLLHI